MINKKKKTGKRREHSWIYQYVCSDGIIFFVIYYNVSVRKYFHYCCYDILPSLKKERKKEKDHRLYKTAKISLL